MSAVSAELESLRNLGVQDKILEHLETPCSIASLYAPFFEKHGVTKSEVLSNLNYLICYRKRVVIREGILYLTENAPRRQRRKIK